MLCPLRGVVGSNGYAILSSVRRARERREWLRVGVRGRGASRLRRCGAAARAFRALSLRAGGTAAPPAIRPIPNDAAGGGGMEGGAAAARRRRPHCGRTDGQRSPPLPALRGGTGTEPALCYACVHPVQRTGCRGRVVKRAASVDSINCASSVGMHRLSIGPAPRMHMVSVINKYGCLHRAAVSRCEQAKRGYRLPKYGRGLPTLCPPACGIGGHELDRK